MDTPTSDIQSLDNENAKILRFMEVFDAEEIENEAIDVIEVNVNKDGVMPPPF